MAMTITAIAQPKSNQVPIKILDLCNTYLSNQMESLELSPSDIDHFQISDYYQTKSTGAHHLYLTQIHQDIPVMDGIINLTIFNDKVFHVNHRFIKNLNQKVNATAPVISAEQAIQKAIDYLQIPGQHNLRPMERSSRNKTVFYGDNLSEENISVELFYFINENKEAILSWNLAIRRLDNSDFPNLLIDASTGEILEETNLTIYCQTRDFSNHNHHHHDGNTCYTFEPKNNHQSQTTTSAGSYRVFELPVESPSHGNRSLVNDPDNSTASPYGWHDVNGVAGAEYTTTQGNNAHAYQDSDGNNLDSNDEPDGGAALSFDFPYNPDNTPKQNQDAAITNLFYATNAMHDISYLYGFDEEAGNFQQYNYGNSGFDNDYVRAEGMDGDDVNNAKWSASGDGSKGRLEMFLWNRQAGGQRVVNVTAPPIVAGLYNAGLANYGNPITSTAISGEVVVVDDGVNNPLSSDGCESNFVNGADLDGKIAIVDRGGCDFEQKTVYAENYGAIALIICDYNQNPSAVLGVGSIPDPTIPTVRIGSVDCQKIRVYAENGLNISLELPPETGPEFLSGSFDNGTIIHEYTHGISNRLTGGPNTTLCLDNNEQMGEGWSDFFALALTAQNSDVGEMPRGISTHLQREPNDGKGIRNYPYSTDMNINPYTYKDIGNERIPHGIGSVWCAMIWDMFWAMVDQYGFSNDVYNGDLGNNRAIQLVMDGMKMQPCEPGFVDARDAILQADQIRYGGANQELLWEVFARRGLGYSAEQGSTDGVDAFQAFDLPPLLVKELKIEKRSADLIEAGQTFDIFIDVYNHKNETLTDVLVTDQLPEGLTWTGISNFPGASQNGDQLEFNVGTLNYLDTVSIAYRVEASEDYFSIQKAFYPVNDDLDFQAVPITPTDIINLFWSISVDQSNTGNFSWYIPNTSAEARQQLIMTNPVNITGTRPALRFYHNYNFQPGIDGGIVEVTRASDPIGAPYDLLSDKMIRNGYPGFVQYTTFIIPELEGFTGNSNGWQATYVDLTDYTNDDVFFRFNFASNDGGSPPGGGYWYIDDVEVMDLFSYNSTACATAAAGDEACTTIPEGGVIVESKLPVGTSDLEPQHWNYKVFPNPANELLTVSLELTESTIVDTKIFSISGQLLKRVEQHANRGTNHFNLNIQKLPKGFYFVKVETSEGTGIRKVVVE